MCGLPIKIEKTLLIALDRAHHIMVEVYAHLCLFRPNAII